MDQILTALDPWKLSLGCLAGCFILFFAYRHIALASIKAINSHLNIKIIEDTINAFEKPFEFIITITGIYLFLLNAPISTSSHILYIERTLRSCIIFAFFWGVYNVTYTTHAVMLKLLHRLDLESNPTIASILSTLTHIFVIIIGFVAIAKEWNYDITGFLASLSIGSVAVAFAAKDTLANVFGSLVIIVDQPFKVGDEISTNGIEGVVESVSFRSTCIRTYPQEKVYIPNSLLSNTPIINYSSHEVRRVDFVLNLEYGTTKPQMEAFMEAVRSFLAQKHYLNPETIQVTFKGYNDCSLDVRVICYTKPILNVDESGTETKAANITPGTFREYMSDINLGLLEVIEKAGVSCAFPSTSIYFANQLQAKATKEE